MSGISYKLDIENAELEAFLESRIAKMENLRPFYVNLGEHMLNSVEDRFDTQTAPDGSVWTPLAPATVANRLKRHGNAELTILRESGHMRSMLPPMCGSCASFSMPAARCMVMISGYRSGLYDEALRDWTRVDYQANTRRGLVAESLWMNFKPPVALHDYSHLGGDYRERERIKRKKARWAAKIAKMDRQERLAIMEVLTENSAL